MDSISGNGSDNFEERDEVGKWREGGSGGRKMAQCK